MKLFAALLLVIGVQWQPSSATVRIDTAKLQAIENVIVKGDFTKITRIVIERGRIKSCSTRERHPSEIARRVAQMARIAP